MREDNYDANKTYTYSYDAGGNITSVKEYAYTTGELGAVVDTISYGYNYSAWKDRLSSYDGQTITYGATGLPIMYRNMVMVWENGRELGELLTADSKMVYYEYDANGLRTSKTIDGTKTEYVWLGDMLIREQTGTNVTYYLYDENGAAIGFEYNGTPYYYLKNVQGDVLSIVDNSGAIVVNYTYNAWGEIISTTGTLASTIGAINKLRYRSYYYDTETGFYYLQSRYYDPVVKRFISPDSTDYLTANGTFDGYNLYAYCLNNPMIYSDPSGYVTASVSNISGDRYKLTVELSDTDVRKIKYGISVYNAVYCAISTALANFTAFESLGLTVAASRLANGIMTFTTSLTKAVINLYDHGKGAKISINFNCGCITTYVLTFKRVFFIYKPVRKQIKIPYFYLSGLPRITWNR